MKVTIKGYPTDLAQTVAEAVRSAPLEKRTKAGSTYTLRFRVCEEPQGCVVKRYVDRSPESVANTWVDVFELDADYEMVRSSGEVSERIAGELRSRGVIDG